MSTLTDQPQNEPQRRRTAARLADAEVWWPGVALVVFAALADYTTTVAGITMVPEIVEGNAIPAAVFDAVGLVPGAALLTGITVGVVIAATELGSSEVRHLGNPRIASAIRIAGYSTSAACSLAAAHHNIVLIAAAGGA